MSEAIPMLLYCPMCSNRHVDVGLFRTKLHHTHACQSCGHVWRPAIQHTVGVQFLPGFRDNDPLPNVDADRVMIADKPLVHLTCKGMKLCECTALQVAEDAPNWSGIGIGYYAVTCEKCINIAKIVLDRVVDEPKKPVSSMLTMEEAGQKQQQPIPGWWQPPQYARKLLPDTNTRACAAILHKAMTTPHDTNPYDVLAMVLAQSGLIERLDRYEALEAHLPEGFAIGDDATAALALKLVEADKTIASLKQQQPATDGTLSAIPQLELRYHSAIPGWVKLVGLKTRIIHVSEGGGVAIDEEQGKAIVAALKAQRSARYAVTIGQTETNRLHRRIDALMAAIRPFAAYTKNELNYIIPSHVRSDPETPVLSSPTRHGSIELCVRDYECIAAIDPDAFDTIKPQEQRFTNEPNFNGTPEPS